MPILAALLAVQPAPVAPAPVPACRAAQLGLSLDGRDGEFDGMSQAGIELAIRNSGPDCLLPALPAIELRDARGQLLPAERRPPAGMHPGPVMIPVRLAAGHRAATDLRWVSGPVYPHSRRIRAASVTVRIGATVLRHSLVATLYGQAGKPVAFDQSPLRAVEGMAAG